MKHLYITDLDDTLLSEGELPPGTLTILRRIIDSGAYFTVATARGLRAAVAPLTGALPRLPIVAMNGAVTALPDGSQSVVKGLDPDIVAFVCDLADKVDAAHCLLATDGQNEVVFAPPPGDEFMDWSIEEAAYFRAYTVIRGRLPTLTEQSRVVRVVICSTAKKAAHIDHLIDRNQAVSKISVQSRDKPGFAWLEIGARTATKVNAVESLTSRLGCSMSDVVYYGDGANDLEIMLVVGESVAVANADSDVLRVADRIIEKAGTGAVVRDIQSHLGL